MSLIKISSRYLDHINWVNSKGFDFVTDNKADIWRINISSNLFFLDHFLSVMQPTEIARANRYFQAKDKNRFIISRGALREILGKYLNQSPSSIEFAEGANKKPYIKSTDKTDLHYNISHSGDWILLAIANSEIGADTEQVNPAYHYHEVLQDNFSRDEINYIEQGISAERFFMLWTRKEALTKATGKGLDEYLKLIPCLDGIHLAESSVISSTNDWLISSFELHEQYIASLAVNTIIEEIRFFDVYFKDVTTIL